MNASTRPPVSAMSAIARTRRGSRSRARQLRGFAEVRCGQHRSRRAAWARLGVWIEAGGATFVLLDQTCWAPPPASILYSRQMTEGHVIIIGGAEDKVRERVILTRFIKLAGGPDARIAVISTASSLGPLAGEMYRQVFGELGAAEVTPIHAMTRAQANDDRRGAHGARVDGHLPDRRQPAAPVLDDRRHAAGAGDRRRHREGAVVAGTSAGASAMSTHMVAFGASGATPKQRMVQMAAGLGLLPGRDRRPALRAAQPPRPAAGDHRPEPVAAGHRRR